MERCANKLTVTGAPDEVAEFVGEANLENLEKILSPLTGPVTSPGCAEYRFASAQIPPCSTVRDVSEVWPYLRFELMFSEPHLGFGGCEVYRDGRKIADFHACAGESDTMLKSSPEGQPLSIIRLNAAELVSLGEVVRFRDWAAEAIGVE